MTNTLALLRLPPISDQDEDVPILALRHQIAILERQTRREVHSTWADQAWLTALPHRLPRDGPRNIRPLVRPKTACAGTAT